MAVKYDVALSCARELEEEVEKVENFLKAAGMEVFFYKNRQRELLSQNLDRKTYEIYHEKSLVKVLFISEEYKQREYTQLEKRLSIDSTQRHKERLIIVNYIGEKLEKEFGKVIYIDGEKATTDEIAMMIQQRVLDIKREQKKEKRKLQKEKIVNNYGIVTGDNASFHNLTFH